MEKEEVKNILLNVNLEKKILDESASIVYVSDMEDYSLVYLNKKAKQLLYLEEEDESYIGKRCYEYLQGKKEPCDFCTNHLIREKKFYNWEFYNPVLKEYFYLKDKMIRLNGRNFRLEVADASTERVKNRMELELKLKTQKTLVDCIQTLSLYEDNKKAIERLLSIISGFYAGDRAYLFEINYDRNSISNTYEWCTEGIDSEIEKLQDIPLSLIDHWMKQFEEKGEFYISNLDKEFSPGTDQYQVLAQQGISSLVAAPLVKNQCIRGFIGVDNPTENINNLLLLTSVAYFIMDDLEKKRSKKIMELLSYHDMLTRVYNRNKYNEAVQSIDKEKLSSLGIVSLDLNGLKAANDKYGHSYGDILIKRAAENLQKTFAEEIYRIGGDEFIVFCRNISETDFERKVDYLRKLTNTEESLSAAIGSGWQENPANLAEQMARVEKMMYLDKQSFYSKRENIPYGHRRSQLSQDLRNALVNGEFVVYLQPFVDLETGKVTGAEALVRRLGKKGELIYPDKFIPMFEREGVIVHLDFYMLEKVCGILQRWKKEGKKLVKIAVNFSRETLLERNISEKILTVCKRFEISPEYIEVEVTESMDSIGTGELEKIVCLIREKGFSVSLDDFGSKYANLSLLAGAAFDLVKFDKTMVDLINEKDNTIVIRYSVALCREMNNMATLAEGIETEEQKEVLRKLGCNYGQGYLFSRPVPVEAFEEKFVEVKEINQK